MNKSHMKGNVGKHVRLFPPVIGVGSNAPGSEEWWFIESATDDDVQVSHAGSGYRYSFPYDQLYSWSDDPNGAGGVTRGCLRLHVQLIAEGRNIRFVPTERGQPAPITMQEVARTFPVASGLQERLESYGFELRWTSPDRRSINQQDVIELSGGMLVSYTNRGQVLTKRRG